MIQEHISLKAYNTFGLDAKARFFCEIATAADLKAILSDSSFRNIPKLMLGGGSNILLTQNFPGLVLKMQIQGIQKTAEDQDHVWVTAGAGENWHDLVLFCLANQYAGVENLSLIPGTVGAAPMQNIGAYGVELTQVFDRLTAIRLSDMQTQVFHHADCHFGYRESIFKNHFKNQYFITDVTLRLNKTPHFHVEYGELRHALANHSANELTIKTISDAVIEIRTRKLPNPKMIGNAGSFFKNPLVTIEKFHSLQSTYAQIPHYVVDEQHYKIPAAWLIEQCCWKGYREGEIGVHQHHALVLVNYGNGSGHAIQKLAQAIQTSVWEKFAIEILPEVNII